MILPTVTEQTFPCRVRPFVGKLRVKISTFGIRMNGENGLQGSITDLYSHAELWIYTKNTMSKTAYDQATGIKFDVPGFPSVYLPLPYRFGFQVA